MMKHQVELYLIIQVPLPLLDGAQEAMFYTFLKLQFSTDSFLASKSCEVLPLLENIAYLTIFDSLNCGQVIF